MSSIGRHLNDFDKFTLVFSALCHDVDHTGRSNNFEVASEGKLSIRYHDKSVILLKNFIIYY